MRVLLISHTCQSRTEGQPKARLLAQMPDLKLRVVVPDRWKHYGKWRAAQGPMPPDFDLRIEKVAWPWAGPAQFYLHWYPGLAGILQEFRPDVIDLWEEPWGLVSAQVCRLRQKHFPHVKIISETEQNIDKTLPPPFEWYRRKVLQSADFVVGRSRKALEIARRKGFRGDGAVVPNAVDETLFYPADKDASRSKLGLTGFVVGYAGRLVEEKGLEELVRAIAACPEDVMGVVIGDGPFRTQLEQLTCVLGIAGRIRFMGPQPLTQLPEWFNAIDVLAIPSRTTRRWKEQFGRVIIEAHACRTAVIGSDSGAIPEVVGSGGLVIPERDAAALAKAILELRDDPQKRQRFAEMGYRAVQDQYTWQRVAERMYAIYGSVLHCSRSLMDRQIANALEN